MGRIANPFVAGSNPAPAFFLIFPPLCAAEIPAQLAYTSHMTAVIRTLWTFPTTAVGLFVGGVCMPLGARWQWVDGVLECHGGGVAWLLEHATLLEGGALAITFGDVV